MRTRILLGCTATWAVAALTQILPASAQTVAESTLSQSSVSVLVEPALNDGRLVVRVAAKNLGKTAAAFGPSSISIAKPGGESIAITPLSSLVDDVRMAAGMEAVASTAPTQGAYASPQPSQRDGRMDVTGFTGGSTVGGGEYVRRQKVRKVKPTISEAEAQAQIAALTQAILQDRTLAPGEVAAGQVVSSRLTFAKEEGRTLHVRVRLAGEEHGFTVEAPKE